MAYKNFSYSTVATAPSPATSGTSLVVQSGDGAKFPPTPFNATVWPTGAQPTTANAEIVRVTAVATDTLTIVRAQEGSSARSVITGDQIAATITAQTFATDVVDTISSSGTSLTVDITNGNVQDITLTGNCTLSLTGAITGTAFSLMLILRQDATGGRTVTWPGSVSWLAGGAPFLQTAASGFDIVTLFTVDGGTTWLGSGGAPAMQRIYHTRVSGTTTSSVDIQSISQNFTHLKLVVSGRSDATGAGLGGLLIRFNNDTAANYDWGSNRVSGTSGSNEETFAATSAQCGLVTGPTAPSTEWGMTELIIPNYTSIDFRKSFTGTNFSKSSESSGGTWKAVYGGSWRSTSAITRITLLLTSGANFVAGSRVTLYGVN